MPSLLSGSMLRTGGSGEFLALQNAQPQLPTTESSSTGYTLITNEFLQTRYASSLGNIEFDQSRMYSSLSTGTITILATGTVSVSTSTASGTLVVTGGVGIGRNLWVEEDIHVNDLTIGRGYEGENNIVFRGSAVIPAFEDAAGQSNIVIGYSALDGLETSYKNIAIGRYALSSGTQITNSIAIGDGALKNLGVAEYLPVAVISGATQANPVVITAVNHGLASGDYVNITDIVGMTELLNQTFYILVDSTSTFKLYSDVILSVPVDGTGYTGYISSGTVNRILIKDNNIAIGVDAGSSLIEGQGNFFFGNQIARNLTTGSYNFFAGRGSINVTNASNIVSINGSNIVDGVDNQINFGSVFYYNGLGFTNFNSNLEVGLDEESYSPSSGAVTVHGGVGVTGNINIGGVTTSTTPFSGSLIVAGGVGIGGNVNLDQELNVLGSGKIDLSPEANVYIQPTVGGSVTIAPAGQGTIDNMTIGLTEPAGASFEYVSITNLTSASSTISGALIVAGGAGIGGQVYAKSGIEDENYLLYTPSVTVTTGTPPPNPRLGDVWIDASVPAYLQYIKDGLDKFWIQVGAV